MLSQCPFCHISLPLPELEWHVNNHLIEDEFEKDKELAQQLELASSTPSFKNEQFNQEKLSDTLLTRNSESSTLNSSKVYSLIGLQIKSSIYKIDGGLMALLKRCLELEKRSSISVISGYIDHYQSIKSEDSGWGCGWRNIQMLSSHLLVQRQEARDVMFGGSGFVPDIPSLQRWLEIAWERGFDRVGSESFANRIYGFKKWIGTTECATVFRSFGLRAKIVDFDHMSYASGPKAKLNNGHGRRKRKGQDFGLIDKFVYREKSDNSKMIPLSCENSHQGHQNMVGLSRRSGTPINNDCFNKFEGKVKDHQVLVNWVWNYFTSDFGGGCDDFCGVLVSEKMPLYFQHDGHSRTIIGIQMHKGLHGLQDQYTLLVLDPGQRTADLEVSLRDCNGWQKLIKRGVHTLKKPQYQLCYVDPGIANGEEIEQLKTIDSLLVKL